MRFSFVCVALVLLGCGDDVASGGSAAGAGGAGGASTGGANAGGGNSGGAGAAGGGGAGSGGAGDPWAQVRAMVDAAPMDELTVIVGTEDANVFVHSKGASTAETPYYIASASKWVTATVLLDLVEQGLLALDDTPGDHIPWWPSAPDPKSTITLGQLLAFKSGFSLGLTDPGCTFLPNADFENCVETISESNLEYTPGTTFHYSESHLQIAAMMALYASGSASWSELLQAETVRLPFLAGLSYERPSTGNPRVASAIVTSGASYAEFLRAWMRAEMLPTTLGLAATDQTPAPAVTIGYSPVSELRGQAWHYGLGHWIECGAPFEPACASTPVESSPGATAFYPFLLRDKGYFVVVATEQPPMADNPVTLTSVTFGQSLRASIELALAAE